MRPHVLRRMSVSPEARPVALQGTRISAGCIANRDSDHERTSHSRSIVRVIVHMSGAINAEQGHKGPEEWSFIVLVVHRPIQDMRDDVTLAILCHGTIACSWSGSSIE